MVRAVNGSCTYINHRITGASARFHFLMDALANCGDVLLRNRAADNLVDEFETAAALHWLELHNCIREHAAPARLPLEEAACAHRLGNSLFVSHLRLAPVGLHLVLAKHPVEDNLKVKLAHAGDYHLAAILVGAHLEGRVFL